MKKQKTISVLYNQNNLPIILRKQNACLNFNLLNKSTLEIVGNKNGLRLLAKSLLGLAEMIETKENEGFHIHIDDLYNINDEGKSFIISKINSKF